ncbi:MAG: MFS transporter [Candidatus Thermoplasmatota archaeon]|nr:MFS transporter [Candidatus Thermoplasmatota archaeon]
MKDKYSILTTVSMYHALNDGAISVVPLLFLIFKEIYNLNYTQIGLITSISLFIHLIAQLYIGRISDGKNFTVLLSFGILLISISLFVLTETKDFFTLLIFLILLRISVSFFHPIGVGWISRTFKKERLDWAMGIQSGSADLGVFVALLTTLYLTEIKGWQFPLYIWSLLAVLIVIIGIFITRNIDEKLLTVKKTYKKQKISEKIQDSVLLLKKIKLLIPAFAISGSAWGIIVTYLPLFLDEKTSLSLQFIGFVAAVWIGIGCITSFSYSRIKSHLGRKNVIIMSYFIIGVACLFLSVTVNVFIILLIMVLLGFSVFLTYPALSSFISEVTDESSEGSTFGIVFTLQLGGGTILIFLSGFLSDIYGIWMPFVILGVPSLFFSILLMFYHKKKFAVR